jgi:hypothetical protein
MATVATSCCTGWNAVVELRDEGIRKPYSVLEMPHGRWGHVSIFAECAFQALYYLLDKVNISETSQLGSV